MPWSEEVAFQIEQALRVRLGIIRYDINRNQKFGRNCTADNSCEKSDRFCHRWPMMGEYPRDPVAERMADNNQCFGLFRCTISFDSSDDIGGKIDQCDPFGRPCTRAYAAWLRS